MQNDIPYVIIGLGYQGKMLPKRRIDKSPFSLAGTIEVQFWQKGDVSTPSLVATVANGRLSVVNATESSITFNLGTDIVNGTGVFKPGFGTMVINRTGAPTVRLLEFPIRYASQSDALPNDNDGTFIVSLRDYVVFVDSRYPVSSVGTEEILDHAVTNGKLAEVATGTLKGRLSAGNGDIEDLTTSAVKTAMQLNNVDNTSDANKPVSTATATALAGKSNIVHGHTYAELTGNPTEIERGAAALAGLMRSVDPGRKFIYEDYITGGHVEADETAGHRLCSIENVPGSTLSTPANGLVLASDRRIKAVAANQVRRQFSPSGAPLGLLIEPSNTYLNGLSQPLSAQVPLKVGAPTDAAAPAGWGGNWLQFGDNTTRRYTLSASTAFLANTDYWLSALIRMDDGLAPTFSGAQGGSGWDFYPYIFGGLAVKNPDTGAAGARLTGPLGDGVYLVEAYVTTGGSGGSLSCGIDKLGTNSARPFRHGRVNFGQGRYPPSMFDNATASANVRAGDNRLLALSGFSLADGLTLLGEFTYWEDSAVDRYIQNACADANSRVQVLVSAIGQLQATYFDGVTTLGTPALSANMVHGQTYRYGASFDPVTGRIRLKVTGIAAPAEVTTLARTASMVPTVNAVGRYGPAQSNYADLPIAKQGVFARAFTANEIQGYTG